MECSTPKTTEHPAAAPTVEALTAQQVQSLIRANEELTTLNQQLRLAQDQLMQSEKLASIGQLAAGVAHEINNPVGYVFSNVGTLQRYITDLFRMLDAYEDAEPLISGSPAAQRLATLRRELDLEYLKEDVPRLMEETCEGIVRVRKIVQDLKDFSHADVRKDWEWTDLHKGIDSTLNIVNNEIKYKATVVKEYAQLPEVQCLASELNQVFLNLLVNAAHALGSERRGHIMIRTGVLVETDEVWVEVQDDGCGIAPEHLSRIFDPFFTTKPVGQGTGLGLSLSYGIVRKHGGRIDVDSELGSGTRFRVTLPVRRSEEALA